MSILPWMASGLWSVVSEIDKSGQAQFVEKYTLTPNSAERLKVLDMFPNGVSRNIGLLYAYLSSEPFGTTPMALQTWAMRPSQYWGLLTTSGKNNSATGEGKYYIVRLWEVCESIWGGMPKKRDSDSSSSASCAAWFSGKIWTDTQNNISGPLFHRYPSDSSEYFEIKTSIGKASFQT